MAQCRHAAITLLLVFTTGLLTISREARGQSAPSQAPTQAELLQRLDEVTKASAREMLQPVVEALRLRSQGDSQLQALLRKLTLAARPRVFERGNAAALLAGKAFVTVDLSLINEVNAVSKLLVFDLLHLEKGGDIGHQVGFKYGQDLAAAMQAGGPRPQLEFHPEKYLSDPLQLTTVRKIAVHIGQQAFAWVVLHEVAHHVLGHTARAPANLAESRADELAADRWALETMKRLGLPLWGAHKFLQARAGLEQVERMVGAVPEESLSDHPSWARRAEETGKRFDVEAMPTEQSLLMFMGVVEWREPGRPPRVTTFMLGTQHGCAARDGVFVGVIKIGDEKSTAICEQRGRQIWFYQRGPDARSEFVLEQPTAFVSPVKMRNIALNNGRDGQVVESSFEAIWVSLAFSLSEVSIGQLTIDAIAQTSALTIPRRMLDSLNVAPAARDAALSQMMQCLTDQRQLALGYVRNQTTLVDYEARVATARTSCAAALSDRLGADVYARFEAGLLADPLVKAGLATLTGDNTQPAASPPSSAPKESARDLLRMVCAPGPNQTKATLQLRPTRSDYARAFTEPAATRLYEGQRAMWTSEMVLSKPDQTEALLTFGDTNDFIDGTPNAEQFAGGWKSVRKDLKRDVPVIRFKCVRPGETIGMAYDGLFYVDGRWVLMPAPWRLLQP
jgi:hypothetical protein